MLGASGDPGLSPSMISDMLSFIVLSVISFIEDGFDGFSIWLVSNAFSRLIIYCLLIAFSILSFSYLGSKTLIFSFKASFSLIIESSDFPSASIITSPTFNPPFSAEEKSSTDFTYIPTTKLYFLA